MITGTTIKDGTVRLILTGTDEIDNAVLKALSNGRCKLVSENYRMGDKSITGGLLIEEAQKEKDTELKTKS